MLIAAGFTVFLILTPLILMYVRGISYDFSTHKFVQTGILAVRTDPKNVKIIFNGQTKRSSSGDIKFLKPGEYEVKVEKDGYSAWTKRLAVYSGQVTWANPVGNKIYLFAKQPAVTDISSGVKDFYLQDNALLYLSGQNLTVSKADNPGENQNYGLPKPADKILAAPNNKTFALYSETATSATSSVMVFSLDAGKVTDISNLFSAAPVLNFSGQNDLYALENGALYRVDLNKPALIPILTGIKSFTFLGDTLYFIKQDGPNLSLFATQNPGQGTDTLLQNLPNFSQGTIKVNFEKQVFLLLDNNLYEVGSDLKKIAGNVTDWHFNPAESTMSFLHSGEMDYYNPFQKDIDFITRSGSGLSNPLVSLELNYAFVLKDNQLTAIELDSRDRQNEYALYSAANGGKFALDTAAQNIFLLDNGNLKKIKIR